MLKLVKYEYRRNCSGILAMLFAIVGLEAYYLIAAQMKNAEHASAAAAMLFIASLVCALGTLLYSVALYSRELNAKTSYLTFMTPNSSAKILGAKLLATLGLGLLLVALLFGFAAWDLNIMWRAFPETRVAEFALNEVLRSAQMDLPRILLTGGALALEFLIGFFSTVVLAYLAITLSATVLQNKKMKGVVSFLIFILIEVALNWGLALLPSDYYANAVTLGDALLYSLPMVLINLVVMVAAFVASAWLLKNKVSL